MASLLLTPGGGINSQVHVPIRNLVIRQSAFIGSLTLLAVYETHAVGYFIDSLIEDSIFKGLRSTVNLQVLPYDPDFFHCE